MNHLWPFMIIHVARIIIGNFLILPCVTKSKNEYVEAPPFFEAKPQRTLLRQSLRDHYLFLVNFW